MGVAATGRANQARLVKCFDSTLGGFLAIDSVVEREIKLNGGEVTILKTLGFSGTPMNGKMLEERAGMETAEFIDTLTGLIDQGYVDSSKVNVTDMDDVERASFRVNSSYSRDLRDALHPNRRREDRGRRQRRR